MASSVDNSTPGAFPSAEATKHCVTSQFAHEIFLRIVSEQKKAQEIFNQTFPVGTSPADMPMTALGSLLTLQAEHLEVLKSQIFSLLFAQAPLRGVGTSPLPPSFTPLVLFSLSASFAVNG